MDIGARLKAERERLKLSQTDFGKLGDAGKTTVIAWERGTAFPNAAFLAAAAAAGLDAQYVVTGTRSRDALSPEELMVLEHYRAADKKVRAAAIGALIAGEVPETAPSHVEGALQIFKQAPTGTVVGRDLIKKKR